MNELNPTCRIDKLNLSYDFHAKVDALRLDLLHPVVSGNKWFKLKNYLKEAKAGQKTVLTFGGAYSNHIAATAAAASKEGLPCIGIIRGEESPTLSHTLTQAKALGMQLFFATRKDYREKQIPQEVYTMVPAENLYTIPEGGYGKQGMEGAKEILLQNNTAAYTHILCAVGTGTTLAGLIAAASPGQKILGVPVMKNNTALQKEIEALLPAGVNREFDLLHDFHFGGYAKYKTDLILFMNELYSRTGIPTDFVYTGKAFFAAFDLLRSSYFTPRDKVLIIHTGGLQGNLSLTKGTLIFSWY